MTLALIGFLGLLVLDLYGIYFGFLHFQAASALERISGEWSKLYLTLGAGLTTAGVVGLYLTLAAAPFTLTFTG